MTGVIIVTGIQAVIPVLHVYFTKLLIDAISAAITGGPTLLGAAYRLLGWQVALTVAQEIFRHLLRLAYFQLQQNVSFHVENLISQQASRMPLQFFDTPASYDTLQRASSGHAGRGVEVVQSVIQIVQSVITLSSMVALLADFHWVLALGLVFVVIPTFAVNRRIGQSRFNQMKLQTQTYRHMSYVGQLIRGRDAAKEIRLFELSNYLLQKWQKLFRQTTKERLSLEVRAVSTAFGADLITTGITVFFTGFLIWVGAHQGVSIGTYVALVQALSAASGLAQSQAVALARIYENVLFISDLFEFIDISQPPASTGAIQFPPSLSQGIKVQDLTFTYPNSRQPTLRDISFTVRPGERIAIVGENGAGKSTLVKCLLGLYTPDVGTVEFDGVDIRLIDRKSLLRNMSAIFQDYVRYFLTLRENIGLGHIDNLGNQTAIAEAADKGGASEILPGLEQGFDTVLGYFFTGGKELSQGQWQKVALSRAFMRDAQVLFLDEPTASLDPMMESAIFQRFYSLTKGKTAFLISHRMGSCRMADRILVLKHGQLVEDGTHDELMDRNGEYARMVRLQLRWSPGAI